MPTLPSGRKIEFSLDRFHAMLEMLPHAQVELIESSLREPNDLLWVLDLVCFDDVGKPHFAECVAADWAIAASDWASDDRFAFAEYLKSDTAQQLLDSGLEGTRQLVLTRLRATAANFALRQAA
jgi:hypothetical protein